MSPLQHEIHKNFNKEYVEAQLNGSGNAQLPGCSISGHFVSYFSDITETSASSISTGIQLF